MKLACERCPVRDSAACSVLSEDERETLARSGRSRMLARGETLFAAGEEAQACATLTRGALKVCSTDEDGTEHILALIHPAGFTGELFVPFARHDVVALTDSELCLFARSDMDRALERHPALSRALLRRREEDLFVARELSALAAKNSARDRVVGLLSALAQAASDSPCHAATRLDLPLSRSEMASMLGLTIETVSRQIGELEKSGAIRRNGRRGIEILDPAAFAA